MAAGDKEERSREARSGGERLLVEGPGGKRPFMRGIMVHSLLARGVPFEVAYPAADEVRSRIRQSGRSSVGVAELAKIAVEVLGSDAPGEHQPPLPLPPSIHVEGENDDPAGAPFSKGLLSQSLLAASLDPNDAFDAAREIEAELRLRNVERISRRDLRHMAYDVLEQRFGPKTARRYRVWRHFQTPDKPVIVLLGGATGAGKTSLALEVALRLGIGRVISTDSIRQVMRTMLSPELMPALHASSFEAYRHLPAETRTADPVIDGFLSQASAVSVGVRAMIDRAIEENTSLVMDGVGLVPGLVGVNAYQQKAHIIYLIVARLDPESFRDAFESRGASRDQRSAARYQESLAEILSVQDYILECADRHDVPIVDNVSVDSSVLLVIRHVVERLRKHGGIDFESEP